MARAGVNSLLIVHTVPMGRMFEISPRDLDCRVSEREVFLCSLEPTLAGGMVFGP